VDARGRRLARCGRSRFRRNGVGGRRPGQGNLQKLRHIDHIVVIYEENHSFDNLYGGWEGVRGLANADAAHTTQVDQNGTPFTCLYQNDVNLAALTPTCNDAAHGFSSAFTNTWFTIDPLLPPSATTCPTILGAFSFPFGAPANAADFPPLRADA
jgi:hypothetical protein